MEFNHTELSQETLADKLKAVEATIAIPHSPERLAQVIHEKRCLSFELACRAVESQAEVSV